MKKMLIGAALILGALTLAAGAQTAPAPAAPGAVSEFLTGVRPVLNEIATLVFTALCAMIAAYLRSRWNIEITTDNRASFQTAVTNAAGLMRATGDMPRAVEYLKNSAPGAIEHFNIPEGDLEEKITAKTGVIEAPSTVAAGSAAGAAGVVRQHFAR